MSATAAAAPTTLSLFLQRLRAQGLGQRVVLHTGRRAYVGQLVAVDAASVRLDAQSAEFEEDCWLEIDPSRIEAFELFPA